MHARRRSDEKSLTHTHTSALYKLLRSMSISLFALRKNGFGRSFGNISVLVGPRKKKHTYFWWALMCFWRVLPNQGAFCRSSCLLMQLSVSRRPRQKYIDFRRTHQEHIRTYQKQKCVCFFEDPPKPKCFQKAHQNRIGPFASCMFSLALRFFKL
jgi:hypothetical protein